MMQRQAISVSALSNYIKNIFDAETLLYNIGVIGEISSYGYSGSNLYFTIKDSMSLLNCVMFGADLEHDFKIGDRVIVTGTPRYYAKGGKLNLYVTTIVPYGSGLLYQKYLELKSKLEIEGVFSDKYKKPLPKTIKTIGVITSQTGAVLHDIQTVSHRRNPSLNIVVYPAKVQGDGAENTIINGLKALDKMPEIDVIVIARGGGSIEDLQPFNTEILAREIIKISKPVVSAVGHETDYTICDFASSVRAATPSVAAELVTDNVLDSFSKTKNLVQKIYLLISHKVDSCYEKLDALSKNLNVAVLNKFERLCWENNSKIKKLNMLSQSFIISNQHNLDLLQNKLLLLNPQHILKNGWAKIIKNNATIKSVSQLTENDCVQIQFVDGNASASILNIDKNKGKK